jgi:hypothetical protein
MERRMKAKSQKAAINVPMILYFRDYHEIDYVCDYLTRIIPGLKSKELSFNPDSPDDAGGYAGIFYLKKDKAYYQMVQEHELMVKEIEEES